MFSQTGNRMTSLATRERSFFSAQWVYAVVIAVCTPNHALSGGLDEPIKPIPATLHQDPARAALGKRLFHDVRLSRNDTVSCASCHDLRVGGADRRDRSIGFSGKATAVNAPTVYNAAFNFKQLWDGRADSLEAQIEAVVQNPVEMGSDWHDVVKKLSKVDEYKIGFSAAYADGLTKQNVLNAIASYERTLITPNSRFDRYLRGDTNAITESEKTGYAKFKQYGCVACHQGVNVGGNMFQKLGVMGDYFGQQRESTDADLGRFMVTGQAVDKHVFKVPSLRNVSATAPYFHDARAKTLDEAVAIMFRYQLGRVASNEDKNAIVAFLITLTDEQSFKL